MKKVLYLGGFELPDKNAAAQRVLSVSKALRQSGYNVSFYGITKSGDFEGAVDGFNYSSFPYPVNTKEWIRYVWGVGITDLIRKILPDYVFTYNYPAIAQERVIRFCHKNGIKVVGDITEWYMPSDFIRKVDTVLRMKWSNKHLDGIIAISRFLKKYYKDSNSILLPPLVDMEELKWKQNINKEEANKIKLIYAGQPSGTKDRLDFIVNSISHIPHDNIIFNIVGITKEQYINAYGEQKEISSLPIFFHGRLSHVDTIRLLMESDFQIFFRPNLRVNNAGFPTKFVEAMTAGVPVIINRISNVDEYLRDGFNGFIINNPCENEIHDALQRVANLSRMNVDKMKANCKRNTFDYHQYVKELDIFMSGL